MFLNLINAYSHRHIKTCHISLILKNVLYFKVIPKSQMPSKSEIFFQTTDARCIHEIAKDYNQSEEVGVARLRPPFSNESFNPGVGNLWLLAEKSAPLKFLTKICCSNRIFEKSKKL